MRAHGARAPMFAPFRVPSFRFQWPADLLTSWAFEMENLILGWYVLVETGSVLRLTVFGALQYLGTLIAPMMGVTSDRIGHRNLLIGMRAIYALLAATLMTFAFAGAVTPMIVLIIAALMGAIRPSDIGVRSALVAETMPSDRLISAMSIARTTTDSARIAGALAGAGVFAAFGMGPAYVVVACFYLLGSALLLGIAPPTRHISLALAPQLASPWHDLKDGIAQVWNTPTLLAVVWLAFLANLTAFPILNGLLPYVAKDVYALGPDRPRLHGRQFRRRRAARLDSAQPGRRRRASQPADDHLDFSLVRAAAGVRADARSARRALSLVLVGVGQSLSMVPLSIILLRAAGEKFRGRVMGVRMMAIYSLPIGLLAGGVLIERIGFRATASLYAVIGLVFTLIIVLRWRAQLWRQS